MSDNVQMPALGESVTEGTVTRWLKAVGESVEIDEPLLEVSTDKVDTEIPSPFAGVLEQILVQEDETVEVGADLAVIGSGAGAARAAAPEAAGSPPPPRPPPAGRCAGSAAEAARRRGSGPGSPCRRGPVAAEAPAGLGRRSEIKLPALGESVTEGTVTRWLKAVGETVEVDEPLLEVSTDKVDTEIPSPVAGTSSRSSSRRTRRSRSAPCSRSSARAPRLPHRPPRQPAPAAAPAPAPAPAAAPARQPEPQSAPAARPPRSPGVPQPRRPLRLHLRHLPLLRQQRLPLPQLRPRVPPPARPAAPT